MKNHDILNEASIVQPVRNAALFFFIYSNHGGSMLQPMSWDAKFQHDVISVHSAVTIQNIQNNNNMCTLLVAGGTDCQNETFWLDMYSVTMIFENNFNFKPYNLVYNFRTCNLRMARQKLKSYVYFY